MIFHSRSLFFTVDLSNYTPQEQFMNTEVDVVEKEFFDQLTEAEQETIRGYGGADLLALFEKRLLQGHRLFLTHVDGEIAGASWIYEGGPGKFFMIPLSEKEFFILAVFIIDKFRGRGISSVSLACILQRMKEYGFQKGFICTKEWNFYQRSIKKAGFELVGKVREMKIFKRNILIWSSLNGKDFL